MLAPVLAALALGGCPATVVHYDGALPTAAGVPLPGYVGTLWDGRVNGTDGLVLWRRTAALGLSRTFRSTGCRRFRVGANSLVARVVANPKKRICGITALENGNAYARPRSSGIRGGWPWLPIAQLTTHGHDGDRNMKIPWWVDGGGPTLKLVGTRLDGEGAFQQEFLAAFDGMYPSIVDIPAAGCWAMRLKTGSRAGVLVVRAVDAHG
jgi:hypothetical protein